MTENNTNKKKKPFQKTTLIWILLSVSIAFLAVALYANLNRDAIFKEIAGEITGQNPTEAPTTPTIPSELTTLGSKQILVDKTHGLPADYVPSNLATPYLNSTTDVIQLDEEAGNQAKEMKEAAAKEDVALIVSSGYVSYQIQDELYKSTVSLLGEAKAATSVAKAGYSENQTGLAIDFTSDTNQATPTSAFADTAASQWLSEHAHEYGFILRYPKGKESITGYDYMPWHYRYVGVDVATAIYNVSPDETFEEYYNLNS